MMSRLALALVLPGLLLLGACGSKKPETETAPAVQFTPPAKLAEFSGDRAFSLLVKQTDFGPRVPNTQAHDSCLAFYVRFLTPLADKVEQQRFTMTGYDGASLQLTNVIARFNAKATQRILLCAHWDSRPRSDKESAAADQVKPMPGANDGASGAAVLLHLAEIFAAQRPAIGVDLVFFDGEDYGKEGDESMYCLGSKYYATSVEPGTQAMFGVLLDLVGDRDAIFAQEEFSLQYASEAVRVVWSAANALGIGRFRVSQQGGILDDHVFLNKSAGIPTVDIIDASLVGHADPAPRRKYWHTLKDTPEQCSPLTLQDVGRVLLYVVYGYHPA